MDRLELDTMQNLMLKEVEAKNRQLQQAQVLLCQSVMPTSFRMPAQSLFALK